ncbi:YobI family P-loop NTPase [Aestuariibaculum sediminum]|uniref:YobI-like P-loop NTPase domain-containing protein n=1 Tax=Aestuariibaculum sediminum TaxID=2770637 RepID=A0A8J6U9T9_9FLAO|nr:hypothetical protein [Aestuariibaculum sediminum]MBD0833732.1 hypothetical protein [Aestuariibaculum sediminum]
MRDKLKSAWEISKNFLKDLKAVFSNKQENQEQNHVSLFNSLSPKSLNPDNVKIYLEALTKGVEDKDINNIALTGSYGSGKSSLIKTFEETTKGKFSFLKISLASFEKANLNKNLDRQLELSILQQIFYHVKSEKIPDSRFKRIKNITTGQLLKLSLGFAIWFLSALIIFSFNYLQKLNPVNWTWRIIDLDFQALIVFTFFFLGVALFAKNIIRVLNNSKISKVSIKGELELGKDIDKSILNQYLDELIYFFERNYYNVVVLEDLDRFESIEIFTKLREINTLLNNSEQRKGDVVFLYAVRDDIFTGKDRTKFFDFIIPVIPVINKSNSNEKLRERLSALTFDKKPNLNFIDDIALFIDDMRLLNNICNEYVVYRSNLSPKLIQDNLLGMIVYKNLRPDDFVELHNGQGRLHEIISNKKQYIKEKISSIEMEIDKLTEKVINIEEETVKSVKELKAIYINALNEILDKPVSIRLKQTKFYSLEELMDDELFEELQSMENFYYKHYDEFYNRVIDKNSNKSFKSLETFVDSERSFEKRLLNVNSYNMNEVYSMNREIEKLREEKAQVQNYTLKQLFEEINLVEVLGSDFSKDKLTIFLLRNGYIDENYYDYISYFHGVSMTRSDNEFLQSVKSQMPNPFNYKLEKVEAITKRLDTEYFKKEAVLNFDLVDFIFKNNNKYKGKCDAIIKQISNKKELATKFLDEYIDKGQQVGEIIKSLSNWRNFWKYIEETKFTESRKIKYLKLIFDNCSIKDIWSLSLSSNLKLFLAEQSNPLTLLSSFEDHEKTKKAISELDLEFEKLEIPKVEHKDIFAFIVKNEFYKLNLNNIKLILKNKNKYLKDAEIIEKNFTTIINSKNTDLIKKVNNNIEEYVNDVFLNLDSNHDESEEALILLLNNKDLSLNIKDAIILYSITSISDLSKIDEIEVKEKLILNESVNVSWNNVSSYYKSYETKKLDSILINYLNKKNVYKELNKSSLSSINEDYEYKKELTLSILNCNDLDFDSFINIVPSTPHTWNSLSFDGLDPNKVEWLIRSKKLNLTIENYDKLKENFVDFNILFIGLHFTKFIQSFENYELDEEDCVNLFTSEFLSSKQKVELFDKLDEEYILGNKSLSSLIVELLSNYTYKSLSFDFVNGLFGQSDSNLDRVKLFNLQSNYLTSSEAKTLVSKLATPFDSLLIPRKRTRLSKTKINLDFVDNLLNKNLISSREVGKSYIKVVSKY